MPEKGYEGRIAVITGGGRGFGKAFGQALAARGAHAVLADLDPAAGEGAAKEIQSEGGEASETMLFLCSDRARFVTGETLRVSAGFALCI